MPKTLFVQKFEKPFNEKTRFSNVQIQVAQTPRTSWFAKYIPLSKRILLPMIITLEKKCGSVVIQPFKYSFRNRKKNISIDKLDKTELINTNLPPDDNNLLF